MNIKNTFIGAGLIITLFAAYHFSLGAPLFGAQTAHALEGTEAVGIVVKTGTRLDTILSQQFTVVSNPCDPDATTTPQDMCTSVLYQNRPVKVYFTAPLSLVNRPFLQQVALFPFAGHVDYVNRADADIGPRLTQYMLEDGNGTASLIYEFP